MRKPGSLFYLITVFIAAQIAWFALLGLWIYWYITNYLLLNELSREIGPQIMSDAINIAVLVGGIILLVLLSVSMSMIFVYLNRQINITRVYDNFIANVTHELKSPLSSIQLYLETLNKHNLNKEDQSKFINLMLTDVSRLGHLINSILYLSSLEQRKFTRKITHDYHIYNAGKIVTEVMQEALSEFNFPAEHYKIEGQADCQCVVDRYWLKIVFRNLIDNAIKYSHGQAVINIRLSMNIRFFYIDFRDNGIGIDQADQKKIFNKFERIYNSDSPNVKGTGLGLFWVKQIIEYHGGAISVKSAGKSHGAQFTIALPVYQSSKKRYINRLLKMSKMKKKENE